MNVAHISKLAIAAALVLAVVLAAARGSATGAGASSANAGLPEQIINTLGPSGFDPSGASIPSGRVQDVAADPFDPTGQHLLALSPSALWESTDGGAHWAHLPGLDRFAQWDLDVGTLAFDPAKSGVVLIASAPNSMVAARVPAAQGIYRSLDGGRTWSQPTNFQPDCPGGGLGNPTVVTFHGHTAVAAGGCAVGEAIDGGNWSWSAPDARGGFYGVAVDSAGNEFACGSDGVYQKLANGIWLRVVDFTGGAWTLGRPGATCRMTAVGDRHIVFTAEWSGLNLDAKNPTDAFSAVVEAANDGGGWKWQDLIGAAHDNGRDVVVQTRPVPNTFGDFDLFWNSSDLWYYQRCGGGPGLSCRPGQTRVEDVPNPPWVELDYRRAPELHADAGRILFSTDAPYCIRLVADDGGIQMPSRGDCDGTQPGWTYSNRGIQALQPYDISVTSITGTSPPAADVYAAAQDSGAYAFLPNEHNGWRSVDPGNDGGAIDATPRVAQADIGAVRVFYRGGSQLVARRGLDSLADATSIPFQAPWSGLMNSQQLAELPNGRLVLAVCSIVANVCAPANATLFTSTDGDAWTMFDAGGPLTGRVGGEGGVSVVAAGSSGAPVMFVRSFSVLYRVAPGSAPVNLLPSARVGPYSAGDANHLLAFTCPVTSGCTSGVVRASDDGGRSWRDLDVITRLVTSDGFGGTFPLGGRDAVSGQVTSVAVSPVDPAIMVVGTTATGLFDSSDRGRSWQRLPFLAPNLWNLRFSEDGRLFLGSFGRGLFVLWPAPSQLRLERIPTPLSRSLRYSAFARTYGGSPISGLQLDFMVLAPDGSRTSVGSADTNSAGRASIALAYPGAPGYKLVAHWSGDGNDELETQADLPAGAPTRLHRVSSRSGDGLEP